MTQPEETRLVPEEPQPKTEAPRQDNDLAARVRDLENALAAARATSPLGLIPLHGAGPGEEVAETWSLAEQEAAIADERA